MDTAIPTSSSARPTGDISSIQWGKTLLIALGLCLFGGICLYIGHEIPVTQSYTPISDTSTPTPTVTMTASPTASATVTPTTTSPATSMKTYTNTPYNFTFQYPSDFAITSTSALTIQPSYMGQAIVSIENPTGQYALSNYKQYSIFGVDESTDTTKCYVNPADNSQMTLTKTVNGTTYMYATASNGAAGTTTTSTTYRVIKGQTCFEFMELLGVSTDGNSIDTTKANASKAASNAELAQIFSTVTFN